VDEKMTRSQRATIGILIVAVIALCYIGGEQNIALFVLLTFFFPYLAFVAPLSCREWTRNNQRCRKWRWGWFLGCEWHRTERLRRIWRAITGRPVASPPVSQPTAQRMPAGSGSRTDALYNAIMLVATVVSAVAGVAALVM
jgi:hypothetical protein